MQHLGHKNQVQKSKYSYSVDHFSNKSTYEYEIKMIENQFKILYLSVRKRK